MLLDGRLDAVSSVLKTFCDQGIKIALDDFGTGYASLTHLKRFPVDHIKIDRSFVQDLEQDPDDEAIVAAVIGLGRSLKLQITAEGVETAGQAQRLQEMGCEYAQGFYFSQPVAGSDVPEPDFKVGEAGQHREPEGDGPPPGSLINSHVS